MEKQAFFSLSLFRIQMVSNLFLVHTEIARHQRGGHMRKSSTVTRKYQAQTVSSKFQQSLLELVEKMERLVRWMRTTLGIITVS